MRQLMVTHSVSRASHGCGVMNRIAAKFFVSAVIYSWLLLVPLGVVHAQVIHDLPKLISSSDVVAVARVIVVNQSGSGTVEVPGGQSIPAHFRVAALHLEDILKGEPVATDLIVGYTILYSP